ncbi:zinc-dependent alcohol dehydrogenase [Vallitalea okinawensis]|uniref:zinc-dependent alcohol dehydrogenase n=1 Tax=Vallitalea okinawensis TaxID=2078660 RepID=UPI000CFA92A4|nr:zinc-binding dehydrogenase [Vallitalea okinawensis]
MEISHINIEDIVKQVVSELKVNSVQDTGMKNNQFSAVPQMAKAAVLVDKKRIDVKAFNIPEINDDEMLVKVEGCGICGTDVHEYKNDPFDLIPVVLGHEGTGEIVKIGKNIKKDTMGQSLQLGDKIVTCTIPCGECDACLNMPEKDNLCENSGIYGLIPDDDVHLNGWFGEYLVIRKGSTYFKVNDMNLKQRILIEPAAVTVHAVERAKSTGLLSFNSSVLVQGCGPIGLMLLAVVRTMGIENIIAVDGDEQRLAMAKRLGAKYTVNFKNYKDNDEVTRRIKEITSGRGTDFAFQCTGVPAAASNIWKFIKRGGGLCEVGFFVDNGHCSINPHFDICNKEITVVGSWVYKVTDYPITFDFIRRATGIGLPIEELITHEYGLNELNEAMATNMKQAGIKIAYINK